jgi:hypothetical protein
MRLGIHVVNPPLTGTCRISIQLFKKVTTISNRRRLEIVIENGFLQDIIVSPLSTWDVINVRFGLFARATRGARGLR